MSACPLTEERIEQLKREANARGECVILRIGGDSVPFSRYEVPWAGKPWSSAIRTADIAYAVWPDGWRYRGAWAQAAQAENRAAVAEARAVSGS